MVNLLLFQYFKRRREAVEIGLCAAGGLGFAIMFLFVEGSVRYYPDGHDGDNCDDGDGDDNGDDGEGDDEEGDQEINQVGSQQCMSH